MSNNTEMADEVNRKKYFIQADFILDFIILTLSWYGVFVFFHLKFKNNLKPILYGSFDIYLKLEEEHYPPFIKITRGGLETYEIYARDLKGKNESAYL